MPNVKISEIFLQNFSSFHISFLPAYNIVPTFAVSIYHHKGTATLSNPLLPIAKYQFIVNFIKNIITAGICLISSLAVSNSTVAERNIPVGEFESAVELEPGDVYMPTLTELFGAPIDDLPEYFDTEGLEMEIVDYAKQFLGTRYRSGAKGPKAFDCSGFTSYVFKNFSLTLGSSSRAQAQQGSSISIYDARPGDLVFFGGSNAGGRVGHVGIVISADRTNGSIKFIHAATSKGVTVDSYPDGGYYSRRFQGIRRVIESDDQPA